MSEADSIDFAQKIANDTELAQQVKLQELTNQLIIEKRFNAIFEEAASNYEGSRKTFKNRLISAGFGFLLLSAIAIYYFSGDNSKSNVNLTNENIQKLSTKIQVDTTIGKLNNQAKQISTIPNSIDNQNNSSENNTLVTVKNSDENVLLSQGVVNQSSTVTKEEYLQNKVSTQAETNIKTSPCDNTTITANIETSPTCIGEANGNIAINSSSIKGGLSPYIFKLNNTDYQSVSYFDELKEGQYQLTIKDKNGCILVLNENVESKKCFKELNFSFNPQLGESWTYQPEINSAYLVKVISSNGQIVWQTNNQAEQEINWQAISNTGQDISSGMYVYEINFANGQTLHGTITILR